MGTYALGYHADHQGWSEHHTPYRLPNIDDGYLGDVCRAQPTRNSQGKPSNWIMYRVSDSAHRTLHELQHLVLTRRFVLRY